MTLIELQEKLGRQIEDLTDERIPFENRKRMGELASVISSLAKQMINNADVVMRADKYTKADGKRINSVVGELNGG